MDIKIAAKIQKREAVKQFTEVVKKIALSAKDDKRGQSIDYMETYGYGTSKGNTQK